MFRVTATTRVSIFARPNQFFLSFRPFANPNELVDLGILRHGGNLRTPKRGLGGK